MEARRALRAAQVRCDAWQDARPTGPIRRVYRGEVAGIRLPPRWLLDTPFRWSEQSARLYLGLGERGRAHEEDAGVAEQPRAQGQVGGDREERSVGAPGQQRASPADRFLPDRSGHLTRRRPGP